MNLPHLGQHCSHPGCGQLDFLPFSCVHCNGIYCLAHHKLDDHECSLDRSSLNIMPECPLCHAEIYIPVNANRDAIMNAHINSGCKAHLFAQQEKSQKSHLSAATKCSQPTGCRNHDKLSTIICAKCGGQFCLTHRLPVTHRCAALSEAEQNGQKPKSSPSPPAASSSSSSSAAVDKHARGRELLAKIAAKREAKESAAAAQRQHDIAHAAAFPTGAPSSSSSSSSTSASTSAAKNKNYLSLQQIRAGINAGAAATLTAISSVLPSSSSASSSPSSSPIPPAATSPSPTPSYAPVPVTVATRARARGDTAIPEALRLYLLVDVSSIKKSRPAELCFFSQRHTIGKVLDIICEHSSIENENHIKGAKRLYLCLPRTGATFPTDITLQLLEGAIREGDTIQLRRAPLEATTAA